MGNGALDLDKEEGRPLSLSPVYIITYVMMKHDLQLTNISSNTNQISYVLSSFCRINFMAYKTNALLLKKKKTNAHLDLNFEG